MSSGYLCVWALGQDVQLSNNHVHIIQIVVVYLRSGDLKLSFRGPFSALHVLYRCVKEINAWIYVPFWCLFEKFSVLLSFVFLLYSVCCTDISSQLAQQAIQTLCSIAKKGPSYAAPCMAALLGLLSLQLDHVSSEILVVFQGLWMMFIFCMLAPIMFSWQLLGLSYISIIVNINTCWQKNWIYWHIQKVA